MYPTHSSQKTLSVSPCLCGELPPALDHKVIYGNLLFFLCALCAFASFALNFSSLNGLVRNLRVFFASFAIFAFKSRVWID